MSESPIHAPAIQPSETVSARKPWVVPEIRDQTVGGGTAGNYKSTDPGETSPYTGTNS